jgi:hypothetical protein
MADDIEGVRLASVYRSELTLCANFGLMRRSEQNALHHLIDQSEKPGGVASLG